MSFVAGANFRSRLAARLPTSKARPGGAAPAGAGATIVGAIKKV